MEFKPMQGDAMKSYAQGPAEKRGCGGLGCVGLGCIGSVVMLVLLCVGSYVAMMHTSLPLVWIKWAIEEDGNTRVQGLRGSITSGFEIDRLEFRSDYPGKWNELNGIRFAYNGFFDAWRNNRLILSEASIQSASFYEDYKSPQSQEEEPIIEYRWFWLTDFDIFDLGDEINEVETEELRELNEIRVDLVECGDLHFTNPETGESLAIDSIQFRDLRVEKGEVRSPGHISVRCDFFDADSVASEAWPGEPFAWLVRGELKPAAHKLLQKPVPVEFDFASGKKDKLKWKLGNGAVASERGPGGEVGVQFADFSPGEYLNLGTELVPSQWNVEISSVPASPDDSPEPDDPTQTEPADEEAEAGEEGKRQPPRVIREQEVENFRRIVHFLPGGSFMLGKTRFELEPAKFELITDTNPPLVLFGTGKLEDRSVKAEIRWQPMAPFLAVNLQSNGMEEKEIWSRLFFEKPYEELDADGKAAVDKVAGPSVFGEPLEF